MSASEERASPEPERGHEPAGAVRPVDALPHALSALDELAARAAGRPVGLFLDFDGTLAPIVEHNEEARLPALARSLLAALAVRRPVAVVSGRELDDLAERVGLPELSYAGCHGLQLQVAGGRRHEPPEALARLPALDRAEQRLRAALAGRGGVHVERKRYAVAAHWRAAGRGAEPLVREAVASVREPGDGLRAGAGRMVLELRPDVDWGKGHAVTWLADALSLPAATRCLLYVGDDLTDEDAFEAVGEAGLAVLVRGRGAATTHARWVLDGVPDVLRLLSALDARL